MYYDDIRAGKYKFNRPLTADERANHLDPGEVSTPYVHTGYSVIRMNSTYLELVDKFFHKKGLSVTLMILCVVVGLIPFLILFFTSSELDPMAMSLIIASVIIAMGWRVWKNETVNSYTHCPMRFNRINRKVYVFKPDGKVMVESWDRLYFHLARAGGKQHWQESEVLGHRLGPDGETVLETFALPYIGITDTLPFLPTRINDKKPDPEMLGQWEFVRRYMENGPQDVYNLVDLVENVDGRRQTWSGGLRATFCKYALHNASWIQKLLAAALCVWLSPFIIFEILMSFVRVVVMRLNKLPEWGFEIERECAVEPGDPYIRDAEHLATHDDAFCRAERIKWECELNSRRWKAG